jgi:hypothetical protein
MDRRSTPLVVDARGGWLVLCAMVPFTTDIYCTFREPNERICSFSACDGSIRVKARETARKNLPLTMQSVGVMRVECVVVLIQRDGITAVVPHADTAAPVEICRRIGPTPSVDPDRCTIGEGEPTWEGVGAPGSVFECVSREVDTSTVLVSVDPTVVVALSQIES